MFCRIVLESVHAINRPSNLYGGDLAFLSGHMSEHGDGSPVEEVEQPIVDVVQANTKLTDAVS